MHKLIIQLQEQKADSSAYVFRWWLLHQQRVVEQGEADSQQSLNEIVTQCVPEASMRGELICIPPSSRVHYRYLEVPKQQRKHLAQLTPFLMESHIGQPLEDVHFVACKGRQTVRVAGVDKALLSYWQSILSSLSFASIAIVPPQYLVAPDSDVPIDFYGDVMMLSDQQVCHIPVGFQRADGSNHISSIEEWISHLSDTTQWRSLNLLQGEFAAPSGLGKHIASWAVIAGLVMLAMLVHVVSLHWQAHDIAAQSERIEQQTAKAFLELVPDEGRVVNLSRQLQARLRQSSDDISQEDMTPYEFLAKLDQVKSSLGLTQGLTQVSYRDGVYRFEWRAEQRIQLDQLIDQLSDANVDAQLEQVVREEQGFRGVYSAVGSPR